MKRSTCALLLLLAATPALAQPTVDVQSTIATRVGRDEFIVVKLNAKDTVWDIVGEKAGYEVKEEKTTDATLLLLRFTPKAEGTYTLVVSAAAGDKVVLKKCAIVVGRTDPPQSPPDATIAKRLQELETIAKETVQLLNLMDARLKALEKGSPPPTSKGTAKHLTFVGPELSAVATTANNDAAFRTLLKTHGIAVHVLLASDPKVKSTGIVLGVEKAGGTPCIVVQDEHGAILTALKLDQPSYPSAFDAMMKTLTPFLEK